MGPIFRSTASLTFASVTASVAITAVMMAALFGADDSVVVALKIAALAALLVSVPVSFFVLHHREKVSKLTRELQAAYEELGTLNAKVVEEASVDPLTGLLNRGHFLKSLSDMRRTSDAGALLYVDVDRFKRINESHGHAAGDEALRRIAVAMKDCLRSDDIVGRVGGEEFAVFLPNTDPEKAALVAEKVRGSVEQLDFQPSDRKQHALSVSIGIAEAPQNTSVAEMLKVADYALHCAKEAGRNRVFQAATAGEHAGGSRNGLSSQPVL